MNLELAFLQDLLKKSIGGMAPTPDPPSDIDWANFFAITRVHLPLPTIARQILCIEGTPAAQKKQLEGFLHGARRRSGLLILELIRLFPALEEAGCKPLVLKGPALAHTVYDSPEDRFYSDLDIIIPADKWVTASRTLASFGYAPVKTGQKEAHYERHHFHRRLVNKTGVRVELHWDISSPAGYYRFDLGSLYAGSRIIRINGVPVRTPSDNHMLLHAATSSVLDGFADLRRIEDAAFLFKNGSLDFPTLQSEARQQGMDIILWCLLIALGKLSMVQVPEDLTNALAPKRFLKRSLLSLGLGESEFQRSGHRPAGFGTLVYLQCRPESATRRTRLLSYMFPNEERLLELGYTPDAMQTRLSRFRITATTSWLILRLGAYQCWRLLTHRPGS